MQNQNNIRRRLIPDIVNLQAFECAARHQNFSRAAQELNLTQSTVSRQIADLESQTGLKLFERIRQRVVLSEAGRRFLPDVKEILLKSERLMIDALAAGDLKSSLVVATLPTFGTKWLVPRIGDFLATRPDIALQIESRSQPFNFEEDTVDLAIHYGQPAWAGGVLTFLCNETVLPTANKELADRLGTKKVSDLYHAPLLHLTSRPKLWADWFQSHGIDVANAYQGIRFDQFAMIMAATRAGLGVALLPTYFIEEELRSGQLIPLLPLPMPTANSYYVVRPETKKSHPTADLFQTWLLAQLV